MEKIGNRLRLFFASLSDIKKSIFILALCFAFAFAAHSTSVLNGYFNMDDFEIIGINHTTSFGESLLIPHGNDHTMPLFMAEMRVLDKAFGQNPLPYNLFFFSLFALIPFFTYLIFKRLGLNMPGFLVFLAVFTGATGWADILTGFNIMTTYMQIILFFSIAVLSHIKWTETKSKKYLFFFAMAVIFAITVDLPGIWVLPTVLLFMLYYYWQKNEGFGIKKGYVKNFLNENITPLLLLVLITLSFAVFFFITFTVLHPGTFLSALNGDGISEVNEKTEFWKLNLLVSNFFSLFSFGVSLPVFVPNVEKILAHPALMENVKLIWPVLKWIIVLLNALMFWFVFRNGDSKYRKLAVFILSMMFVTISMVVVARPDHELVPNFDYRYAGPAFYAYSVFFALCAVLFLKAKKEYALKIVIPAIILVIALQQAFGFQGDRLKEEAISRKEATVKVNESLLKELQALGEKNDGLLVIPNLYGARIFEGMQGYTLADYILFFNRKMPIKLVQNAEMPPDVKTHMAETVASLRDETGKEFKDSLKNPGAIRNYYASSGLMRYKNIELPDNPARTVKPGKSGRIVIERDGFDPEKKNKVVFSLYTDNTPGNLELSFSFKNDFGVDGMAGKIRIDDYTPYSLKDGLRQYDIETNLLQLYVYSLSESVSDLAFYVPETKNSFINDVVLR